MKHIFRYMTLCIAILLVLCFAASCSGRDPVDTEPIETEPEVTDPQETDPVVTEPAETEPAETEPEETEPAETKPAETEPAETEPAETEPEETEPVVTEPAETEPEKYIYDLKDFTVVLPYGSSAASGDALADLREALVDLGVKAPVVSDDKTLAADTARKEILLGSTNRPETAATGMLLKSDKQYVIAFYENKIVVAVKLEQALPYAIESLIEALSEAENGVLSIEPGTAIVGEASFKVAKIFSDSKIHYNIVLPEKPTKADEALAARLLEYFEVSTGEFPEMVYEGTVSYRESTKSILIGDVKYPEVEAAYVGLEQDEYAVRMIGSKIVLAGYYALSRDAACDMLLREMSLAMDSKNESMTLYIDTDWQGREDRFILFPYGTEEVSLDNENQTMMFGYSSVKSGEYADYCRMIEAEGYALWQENEIGQNLFKTYRKGTNEICVNYYPGLTDGTVHIFVDNHTETVPIPDANRKYTKVSEATLHVMSLDYTHRTVLDGNGMCYVITLEDGRYIVLDGGYSSYKGSKDAQIIYEYLAEHNQRKDGKVVIAAWFMSHPHGDHYGAFESFVDSYKEKVTLEYFIANPFSLTMSDGEPWFLDILPDLLEKMNASLIKPHAGQILTFCNTELEVLLTHENLYPNMISDTNNTSTVIRMKQNGHTVLFTGDAMGAVSSKMVMLYGDELKSDIFQVNHHGCSGGTWELYDIATREDSLVLWTCSKEAFFYRTLGYWVSGKTAAVGAILQPNRDLALKVGFENCLYADGVVEQITFPKDGAIRISDVRDYAQDPQTLKDESEMGVYPKKYTYDLSQYTVVRPNAHDSRLDEAVGSLYEALLDAGISDPELIDDYRLSADSSRKEILIGLTNQPESAEALALMESMDQYAIVFLENKIVIQVFHYEALKDAVQCFVEEYLSEAKAGILTLEEQEPDIRKAAYDVVALGQNATIIYSIILPEHYTKAESEVAESIAARIKAYMGVAPTIQTDREVTYDENAFQILVGNTSFAESRTVFSELSRSEYEVRMVGNKIVVAAHEQITVKEAGSLLLSLINRFGDSSSATIILCLPHDLKKEEVNYFFGFPEFTGGTLTMELDNQNNTMMYSYSGASKNAFDEYGLLLLNSGFTLWQEHAIGENLFRTYRSAEGELCVAYYPSLSQVHVFSDNHSATAAIPDADKSYVKLTEATLHVMSLDYTHRTVYDGHGMNYVITLEDGRYIVLDGGYNDASGSKDAERIYNYLVENNIRADGKVVIAAWFMSHPHGDHVGAFESFVHRYSTLVKIEYFIANPYNPTMSGETTHWMVSTLTTLLDRCGAKLIKPHAGQIITFCNTELEVIYTHENLYPTKLSDTNNSSTVIRMHQNGHTALFSGDASTAACNKMVALYGNELKSDMFQVNHHGCSGGTWAFYDAATSADSYVLWTCSKETFYYRTLGYYVDGKTVAANGILKPNRDLALKVGFEKCFYADGVVEQITFPLDGEITISANRDVTLDPKTQPMP